MGREQLQQAVRDILRENPEGMTADEVHMLLPPGVATPVDVFALLFNGEGIDMVMAFRLRKEEK